tara:strand:- start:95 stop:973 length:879 start_codon:yes stop_codon:yes gene_type:complete
MVLVDLGGKLDSKAMDYLGFGIERGKIPFTSKSRYQPYTASYQTAGLSRAGQFKAPAASVSRVQNPFAQSDKYDVFGGGDGKGVGTMNTSDLKELIKQLQAQLDSEESEEREELNESRRRNLRRRPTYKTRLNESSIMAKVKEYSKDLEAFAKRKGIRVDELKKALTGLGTGAVDMSKEVAQAVGEFLGVLVANKEIQKSVVDDLEKNLKESIKRSKNVIKLTEADLYKIVDRVLNENKEGKGCAESEGGSGCIKKKDGQWVIMNNKKGGIFKKCSSKKDCEEILAGYHASK